MTAAVPIDDPGDPRVADFVGLNDPALRRLREQTNGSSGGFLVAEGVLVIRQLLRSSYPLRTVLATERGLAGLGPDLDAVTAPVHVVSPDLMSAIAGFHFHRGALASADRLPPAEVEAVVGDARLVVVAEGLTDNENLGALFRNAAAFGAGAVVLDPTCADPLYRRSIRVSMGQALRLPFTRLAPWPAGLARLSQLGFQVLALTPDPAAEDVWGLGPGPRLALLVGSEGGGLSAAALAAADRRVRIPMAAGVDSLNVATAAAVALHHLAGPR